MSLRMQGDLKAVPQSVVVGQGVVVEVKVENTDAAVGKVRLDVELKPTSGLGKAPELTLKFEPAEHTVPARKREPVRFIWRATLPSGTPGLTYRGSLVLRDVATGKDLGRGALDVYVRAA